MFITFDNPYSFISNLVYVTHETNRGNYTLFSGNMGKGFSFSVPAVISFLPFIFFSFYIVLDLTTISFLVSFFSHLLPTVLCDLCKMPRKVLLTKTNCLHLLPIKLLQCFRQLSKKHNLFLYT